MKTSKLTNLAVGLITALGCSGLVGDLCGIPALKGIGAASVVAPIPKVFCDNNGLEGFASEFTLQVDFADGKSEVIPLTPEIYSKLVGPYNRRNVYGAALSYGPKLPRDLWHSVFEYGFGPEGPLLTEFGFTKTVTNATVTIRTKTRGRDDFWVLARQ